ncbi:MFS transporter [Patescibacteria group bacterium]|nr:MFS transporter [Patescibacteria group bacterium]MBU1952587.1 MFS transporter [Patescibacteria group bacterium]
MFKLQIKGSFGLLSNRNFVKLWLAQSFSQPAGHMLNFVLVLKIFEITESNFIVSLLVALITIPPILFSSMAGVLADSLNRKFIMIISNLLRGVVVLGLIFFGDSYHAILVFAFLVAFIEVFFGPAMNASIPTLTKKENLFSANTLFLFTLYASFLIGYSLAGPFLVWFGEGTYYFLVTLFFLAALMNTLLPALDYHIKDKEEISKTVKHSLRSAIKKLREGLSFIRHNYLILTTVLQIAFVFAVERGVVALVPDFALNFLHMNVDQISYFLITPVALGALFGALLANRLKNKISKRKIINAGILVNAFTLTLLPVYEFIEKQGADFGFSANFYGVLIGYVMILTFLSGMADVAIIVSAQTMLQEETQLGKRGRVFGNLTMVMNFIGLPVILLVGYLASIYPVERIITVFGVLTFVVAIISWVINKKKLDPMFE